MNVFKKFKITGPSAFRVWEARLIEAGFRWCGQNAQRYPLNIDGSLDVSGMRGRVHGVILSVLHGGNTRVMRPVFGKKEFRDFTCDETTTPIRWLKAAGLRPRVPPVFDDSAFMLYEKQARATVGAWKEEKLANKKQIQSFAKWKEEKLAKERAERKKQKDAAARKKPKVTVEVTVKYTVDYPEV